jgi:membrane-associated protein
MDIFTTLFEYARFLVDFILHIDVHLDQLVATWGVWVYVILFVIVFCETGLVVTPFLPGDSLLFATGAIIAREGSPLNLGLMMILLIVAGVLGDAVNYSIGKAFGPRVFTREDSFLLNRKHLEYTQSFYQKHGGKTIIIARFMPIVRTFAPFVAGIGHMSYRRFAMFNVVGAVLWVVSFLLLGNFFGDLPIVKKNFTLVIFAIIILSVLPGVFEFMRVRRANRRARPLSA